MKMNDEQNYAFMNDSRRLVAENNLRNLVCRIQSSIKADCPNADYYLNVLQPLLKDLEIARNNLIVIEATVQAELLSK